MAWLDIDVLHSIQNRDKYYKKSSRQAGKLTRTILNMQDILLKKIINKKKLYFEEKNAENKNNPKEL